MTEKLEHKLLKTKQGHYVLLVGYDKEKEELIYR